MIFEQNFAKGTVKCKAEEWDIVVAMSIDDNIAVGKIYGEVYQNIIVSVRKIQASLVDLLSLSAVTKEGELEYI